MAGVCTDFVISRHVYGKIYARITSRLGGIERLVWYVSFLVGDCGMGDFRKVGCDETWKTRKPMLKLRRVFRVYLHPVLKIPSSIVKRLSSNSRDCVTHEEEQPVLWNF